MIAEYIEEAMKFAAFERLEDGSVYGSFSTERLRGVWSDAATEEEARGELAEVLEEWVLLRISRGLPVPVVNGVSVAAPA